MRISFPFAPALHSLPDAAAMKFRAHEFVFCFIVFTADQGKYMF
jgi:hypothetical protein